MSGLLAIHCSEPLGPEETTSVCQSLNLGGYHNIARVDIENGFLATSHRRNELLAGPRYCENDRWVVSFCGDVVDHLSVPFEQIIRALSQEKFEFFEGLNGVFALAAYDKKNKVIYAVSDRRSQKPLYYLHRNESLYIATELASFCRLDPGIEFNAAWLWQCLFFDFPVATSTFLSNVDRLTAASVLMFDCRTNRLSLSEYTSHFARREPLLRGQHALERASKVFADRIPRYFEGAEDIACALTGGWDGRTMLAAAPEDKTITAYTYGCAGCADLIAAESTARLIGVQHREILFDEHFVRDIPAYALESAYLSSGLQGILRSSLLYVYKLLTDDGTRFPLTISGISMDGLFRGHLGLVPDELVRRYEGKNAPIATEYWQSIVGSHIDPFMLEVSNGLSYLQDRFGSFEDPEHHLSYSMYPLVTDHFSGEIAVSDHFTTVRAPSWDNEIVNAAYSIEQSALSYSQYLRSYKRGGREEMMLQAYFFKRFAPRFFEIPVGGRRPSDILGGATRYNAYRLYHGSKNRIKKYLLRQRVAPLEDWESWLFDRHAEFVRTMISSSEARVNSYIEPAFISQEIDARNTGFVGKLLKVEIVLRLIESGWQRFWE